MDDVFDLLEAESSSRRENARSWVGELLITFTQYVLEQDSPSATASELSSCLDLLVFARWVKRLQMRCEVKHP